jgi:hypothetical protein
MDYGSAAVGTSPPPDTGTPSPEGLDAGVARAFGAPGLMNAGPDYSNDKRLLEIFEEDKKECLDARWVFERQWWRHLLYTLGRQWIYYDRKRGQWLDKRMAKWMPRPVTNKVAEGVEALLAMFAGIELATLARPVGGDIRNVAAAEVADEIQPFIHEEHEMNRVMRDHDFWLIVTGNVFLHPCWDKTGESGFLTIPFARCLTCQQVSSPKEQGDGPVPTCPTCGGLTFDNTPTGPDGQPIVEQQRIGRGKTVVVSPWEIAIPAIYTTFEDTPKLMRMSWRPKDYYLQQMPELAKKLSWETTPHERSLQLLRTLATQSDFSSMPLSYTWGAGQELESTGKSEYEIWRKPTKEWPEGLYFKVVGEGSSAQIVREGEEPGPLPYQTNDNQPIFNWIHTGYQPVGGRLWARGPLELVIQKQDQINQLDALIQLIIQRTANPIWLEPKGAEVRSFTGEPGLVVRYNSLAANGAKPERIQGENVPPTLFQLRQQYLTDFEQLMGTFDVIKGAKPTGVEAFSALQLLVERGQSRFATVFSERGEAYRKWFQMALELERSYGPTERVLAVVSPNSGWTYKHFENADLQGAVSIMVEDGTDAPKTNLGRRAAIEQANQLALINPQDPEQRYNILKSLGLNDLVETLDYDVKSAKQEQDAFEQWVAAPEFQQMLPQLDMAVQQWQLQMQQYQQQQQVQQLAAAATGMELPMQQAPPPQLPPMTPFQAKLWHEPSVHFGEHRKWANGDRAREIFQQFPVLEQFFTAHLQEHQMAMQPPAPAEPPKKGGAMERSNSESGEHHERTGSNEGADKRGPE